MTPYEFARSKVGTREVPGRGDDPFILECLAGVGIRGALLHDETAWCAAFVHRCLAEGSTPGTGKALARSYMAWGEPVTLADAQPGDLCVFWRNTPGGPFGHVGFFVRRQGTSITVLGGNQGNAVCEARYPQVRLLGVRRATT